MQTQVQVNTKYSKSYATYERAVKAATAVADKIRTSDGKLSPRFIVTPCGENNSRFSAVFIGADWAARWICDEGFMVAAL